MTALGTIVFSDEVVARVVEIRLQDRRIIIDADIEWPHPAFDLNTWRVHGADGSLIYALRPSVRPPVMVGALDGPCGGVTHIHCPVALVGGDLLPADPIEALPWEGEVFGP